MARVVWTNDEKDAIFARMEQFFRMHPNGIRKDALREAQSVLNSSRWIVVTDQRVYNYKDRIEIARQKALKWREKVPAKAPEAPAPIPAPPPAPERKETSTERLAGIFEQLLDILADKVADRLADRMADVPARRFEPGVSLTEHRPRHNPEPVSQPRQFRPGVLVLGLLPQTGEQMRREFGHRLDIQWYDSDDATKRHVHPMANVVLMTKFINHSIQERWRKAGVLHYCNGGSSELRQILASL
jgi:hypothetical protein